MSPAPSSAAEDLKQDLKRIRADRSVEPVRSSDDPRTRLPSSPLSDAPDAEVGVGNGHGANGARAGNGKKVLGLRFEGGPSLRRGTPMGDPKGKGKEVDVEVGETDFVSVFFF